MQRLVLPPPRRMHYEVTAVSKGQPIAGNATLQWRHDGEQYEASLDITGPLGMTRRSQRSTGRITEDGLAPRYFSDKARSEQAVHFQPDEGRVIFSSNRPQAMFVAGMQDRLSVLLQLAAMVAGDPVRHRAGSQLVVRTASTRDADDWTFEVEGDEEVTLPAGTLRTVKLQRRPRREYDQRVELWLAPGQDYAPVRVRLTNPNGDVVDQRWSSTDR